MLCDTRLKLARGRAAAEARATGMAKASLTQATTE